MDQESKNELPKAEQQTHGLIITLICFAVPLKNHM
jgi:hypothetical protein